MCFGNPSQQVGEVVGVLFLLRLDLLDHLRVVESNAAKYAPISR